MWSDDFAAPPMAPLSHIVITVSSVAQNQMCRFELSHICEGKEDEKKNLLLHELIFPPHL